MKALQAVIRRHDILRTGVVWEGLGEALQVVWREAPLGVEEVGVEEYERIDPRQYRMEISQAPLLRAWIAEDREAEGREGDEKRWRMTLLHHHLIDDNTSLRFAVAEIEAHLMGRAEELGKPMPFRNLVAEARLG